MVSFLGTGLLGSNFVKAMLRRGTPVQVWNRTPAKAQALEELGAKAFGNVADAVRNADYIHCTLKDDNSVDEVLEQASAGFKQGAIIIDHTTTSAGGAVERTKKWKERGFTYLHAPVFMGPQNALDATGFMLVSGDQQLIARVEPMLSPMTGKLLNFGDQDGKAAAMKLIGNLFLVVFTAGVADAIALGKAQQVPVSDIEELFRHWNPASMMQARIQRVAGGKYDNPSWELNMARKDTGLFLSAAEKAGVNLVTIPSIARQMDRWIEKGHGQHDWTVIGSDAI